MPLLFFHLTCWFNVDRKSQQVIIDIRAQPPAFDRFLGQRTMAKPFNENGIHHPQQNSELPCFEMEL